ncbi:hypothetical protein BJX65DRAFT_282126 [Aspergillus insuetus]
MPGTYSMAEIVRKKGTRILAVEYISRLSAWRRLFETPKVTQSEGKQSIHYMVTTDRFTLYRYCEQWHSE